MSRKTPWAILLCKFKDDGRGFASISKQSLVTLFTAPDVENVVTFWQDVSYGGLDLSGSEVFGWLTLEKNQTDYEGDGTKPEKRWELVDWARKAAADAEIDLSRHYGIIVYMSTPTDLWGGNSTVVCDVDSSLSHILQEVGHGYGLRHSRAVEDPVDYTHPFCIMSGLTFGGASPTFTGDFGVSGPGLCSPYAYQAGWLSSPRIARITSNGRWPVSTKVVLSPLGERNPSHPQVAMLDFNTPNKQTYFVEYRSGGWDRGLSDDAVVVSQLRPDGYAYYAGHIPIPNEVDESGSPMLPTAKYSDAEFDLSVQVLAVLNGGRAVYVRIAPAAAVATLSVREVARSKLGISGGFSVGAQIMQPGATSLREGLIELLGRQA